jgi:hypothetical protein
MNRPVERHRGNTEAERFDNTVRKMFTVSKADVLKQQAKEKRERGKKQRKKS